MLMPSRERAPSGKLDVCNPSIALVPRGPDSWDPVCFTGQMQRTAHAVLTSPLNFPGENFSVELIPGIPSLRMPKQLCWHFKQT